MRLKIYKEFNKLFKNDKEGLKQQIFLKFLVRATKKVRTCDS